jgi:hypothetical protein
MKKTLLPVLALAILFSCQSKDSKSDTKDEKEKSKSEMRGKKSSAENRELDEDYEDNGSAMEADNDSDAMSAGWGSKDEDAFMESCVSGAKASMGASKAEAYCSCVLEKIEVKYPSAIDALKLNTEDMMQMAQDCLAN